MEWGARMPGDSLSELPQAREANPAQSTGQPGRETASMTPRERVLRAVNHQLPDRVPIDLGGTKASGIAVMAYDKLKRMLGIATPTKVLDPRFMIAVVEDEVLRRLHVDVVPLDLSVLLQRGPPGRRVDPAPAVRRHAAPVPAGHQDRRRRGGELDPARRRRLAHLLPHAQERLLLRRHVVQPGRPDRPAKVPAGLATSPTST